MPTPYRSKSVRRFDETNCQITNIIEKDNIKVLVAASVQLFISTPQLEKWFKSSTGTICFLKDLNRKSWYYFRLYSLMQGQLWEQEIESPFVYEKLSPIFHYLTFNKFNYGFKFICQDEADRFFLVVNKFSTIFGHERIDHQQAKIVRHTQSLLLNSTTITNGHSLASVTNKQHGSPTKQSKTNCDEHSTPTEYKSRLIGSNPSPLSSTHSLTDPSGQMKPAFSKFLCSKSETVNTPHRSRRLFYSSERSRPRRIEKSDISCPFRCLRKDLDSSTTDQNITNNSSKSRELIVQRTRSAAYKTATDACENSPNTNLHKLNMLPYIISSCSSSSIASKSSLNSQRKLVISSERKIECSPSRSYKAKFGIGHDKEDLELEATKQILIEYKVPINNSIVYKLRSYIREYGSIDKFQESLKSEEERYKLNLFIAFNSFEQVGGNKSNVQVKNNYTEHRKTSSPNQLKYQASMPPKNLNLSSSPSTPRKQSKNLKSSHCNPNITPITPTMLTTSNLIKPQNQKNFSILTPISIQKSSQSINNVLGQPPAIPQADRTPVRFPNHLVNINNRNQTPSPSRSSSHFKQNLSSITPSSIDTNAPPKPPRRTSLKTTVVPFV